jgi:hypothetical protein
MRLAPHAKDPAVLSYQALRKAVGWVALLLPFALALPWWVLGSHVLPTSISGYYYTGMRNLLEGSLCAIALFNLCCRGYDFQDELAGIVSALSALGVAFFPTSPECATPQQDLIGDWHLAFASLLFATLAVFCLFLFTMSAHGHKLTHRKRVRNILYQVCGGVILASMAAILAFKLMGRIYLIRPLGAMFIFETTALLAFGIAWLVKGGTFLKDETG